ncbi:hypothetical protein P175DRAFT_0531839 [Aspergillus ochraceoroseus IBT 24754]|uniref:Uncharacterized protein n=1 Tax=Aspergillus ochraceoroseus IBT 24754 TaxID=1392256 RepID=A0A2T5LW83_9EURO|nr:uncharacterized protein P175DRAFT_0531839 [Aspergillus ochraceoroseus IBT 24754]PTU20503.1 hypothetical protein P175DRAFT_0531839 [Aspergillus ochraceoroseus IBT 24754]
MVALALLESSGAITLIDLGFGTTQDTPEGGIVRPCLWRTGWVSVRIHALSPSETEQVQRSSPEKQVSMLRSLPFLNQTLCVRIRFSGSEGSILKFLDQAAGMHLTRRQPPAPSRLVQLDHSKDQLGGFAGAQQSAIPETLPRKIISDELSWMIIIVNQSGYFSEFSRVSSAGMKHPMRYSALFWCIALARSRR